MRERERENVGKCVCMHKTVQGVIQHLYMYNVMCE